MKPSLTPCSFSNFSWNFGAHLHHRRHVHLVERGQDGVGAWATAADARRRGHAGASSARAARAVAQAARQGDHGSSGFGGGRSRHAAGAAQGGCGAAASQRRPWSRGRPCRCRRPAAARLARPSWRRRAWRRHPCWPGAAAGSAGRQAAAAAAGRCRPCLRCRCWAISSVRNHDGGAVGRSRPARRPGAGTSEHHLVGLDLDRFSSTLDGLAGLLLPGPSVASATDSRTGDFDFTDSAPFGMFVSTVRRPGAPCANHRRRARRVRSRLRA